MLKSARCKYYPVLQISVLHCIARNEGNASVCVGESERDNNFWTFYDNAHLPPPPPPPISWKPSPRLRRGWETTTTHLTDASISDASLSPLRLPRPDLLSVRLLASDARAPSYCAPVSHYSGSPEDFPSLCSNSRRILRGLPIA